MTLLEFKNTEFRVRSVRLEGVAWFVAADVGAMIGLSRVAAALSRLDDDEKTFAALNGEQGEWLLSESGLYSLISRSRNAAAKVFRRWMASEVLPALRLQGDYRMQRLDEQRVFEVKAEVEGVKQKLARNLARLWKVQEVEGNVSLKAYLMAAEISLSAKECMQLGARCNFRCRAHADPVGKLQQRRGRTKKLSAGHQRYGWHLVATFPPKHIEVELNALGYVHGQPTSEELLRAMKSLVPIGHRLNPPTPTASLYR